jgi:hypothetical protein
VGAPHNAVCNAAVITTGFLGRAAAVAGEFFVEAARHRCVLLLSFEGIQIFLNTVQNKSCEALRF